MYVTYENFVAGQLISYELLKSYTDLSFLGGYIPVFVTMLDLELRI